MPDETLSLPPGSTRGLIKNGEMTRLTQPKEQSTGTPMIERARELLGQDFLGEEAVRTMEDKLRSIGVTVRFNLDNAPPAYWNEEDLAWAKDNGEMLVLGAESMDREDVGTFDASGLHAQGGHTPVTLITFRELFRAGDPLGQANTLFYPFQSDVNDWYAQEGFANQSHRIHLGWRFVKKDLLEGSVGKKWADQTQLLKQYEEGLQKSGALRNTPRRRTATEAAYDSLLYYLNTGGRLLPYRADWTQDQSSDGNRVDVGRFGQEGVSVRHWLPNHPLPVLGVCPTR